MSMRVEYKSKNETENLIQKIGKMQLKFVLNSYGKRTTRMLAEATPKDTGKTAESWSYEVEESDNSASLTINNSNKSGEGKGHGHIPIVQLIRYGHTTRNGGYVAPNDFVSPIAKQMFDEADNKVWSMYRKGN